MHATGKRSAWKAPAATLLALWLALSGLLPLALASGSAAEGSDDTEPAHVFKCGYPDHEAVSAQYSGTSSRYLAATSDHAYIYVDGGNPTQEEIDDLANEFDDVIWPPVTSVFGTISKDRINIHIDAMDGPYGLGGYYYPGTWDIYIDYYDLSIWGYEIATHEFQHLIHDKYDQDEDLWVNEGDADLAIFIVYGPNALALSGHLDAFEDMPDNDLTVFQNEIYDYGSAYAFTLWVWEHFGGNDTIRKVVADQDHGFAGYLNVLKSVDPAWDYDDIELFSMWSVANILDDNVHYGGIYGYESIDMSMFIEESIGSYPYSTQSDVLSWGNDYWGFKGGDKRDLVLTVGRIDGSLNFTAIGIGSDVLVTSAIVSSANSEATLTIPSFGSAYQLVYLAASGWEGKRYSFQADLRDNSPPVTAIAVSPETPDGLNGYYITRPTIGFAASEPATTYYHWDDGNDVQYCPSCTPSRVPEVMEGAHTLYYHSVDPEGNKEAPDKSRDFLVDSIKPEAFANLTPMQPDGNKGWYTQKVTVSIGANENASIFYRWDSGFFHNYTGEMVAEEGEHTLFFYAKDPAGNEGETHFIEVKVDTRVPVVSYDVYPATPDGLGGFYKTQPTVAIAAAEPDITIYYSVDGSTLFIYQQPVKISEGTHSIELWAEDEAGNKGEVHQLSFNVDTVVPTTKARTSPAAPDGTNGWFVSEPIVILETDKDATPYYRLDDGAQRRYVGAISIPEGKHTVHYWAKDKAGNVEAERTFDAKFDETPPVTKVRVDGNDIDGWYLDPPTVTLELEEGAKGYYSWDEGAPNTYIIPLKPRDGSHELTYYSVDEAGNEGNSRRIGFMVDSVDPVAYFVAVPTATFTGDEVIFDATNSSDNMEIAGYSFDFGDGIIEDVKGDPVINHVYTMPGSYHVTLTVTDTAGRKVSYSRDISVEKKPKKDTGELTSLFEDPLVLLVIAVVVLGIAGAAIYRNQRQKELMRHVEAYEAYMARQAALVRQKRKARPKAKAVARPKK